MQIAITQGVCRGLQRRLGDARVGNRHAFPPTSQRFGRVGAIGSAAAPGAPVEALTPQLGQRWPGPRAVAYRVAARNTAPFRLSQRLLPWYIPRISSRGRFGDAEHWRRTLE